MFLSLNPTLVIRGNTVDPISPDVSISTGPRYTTQRTENIACGICVAWDRIGGLKRMKFRDSMSHVQIEIRQHIEERHTMLTDENSLRMTVATSPAMQESDDGLTWTKPNLGLFEFNGNPNNNIVWDLHGACVFRDDEEPDPQRRYKMIGFCRRYRNIFLLTSPDGIRWDDSDYLEPVADRDNEGAFNVIYDKKTDLFRAYALIRGDDKDARRMIAYTESPSLEGPWKPLEPMFGATDADDAVGVRRYGADRAEIHNMSGFLYHNIYIGIPGVLYVTGPGAAEHEIPIDGPIDAQFVSSRDGFNWEYPDSDRTPIIPRGESGTFDTGMIMGTAIEPIITDDEIRWYYTGTVHTHGAQMKDRHKEIGLAKWRLDGFVSLDAEAKGDR